MQGLKGRAMMEVFAKEARAHEHDATLTPTSPGAFSNGVVSMPSPVMAAERLQKRLERHPVALNTVVPGCSAGGHHIPTCWSQFLVFWLLFCEAHSARIAWVP